MSGCAVSTQLTFYIAQRIVYRYHYQYSYRTNSKKPLVNVLPYCIPASTLPPANLHCTCALVQATTNSVSRRDHHSSSFHIIVSVVYNIYQSWCWWQGCACYRSEATHDTKSEFASLQHGGNCHAYKQPFHAEQKC